MNLIGRAGLFYSQGNIEKAIKLYKKALQHDPNNVEALEVLQEIYYSKNKLKTALSINLKLLSLSEEARDKVQVFDLLSRIGRICELQDQREEAIKHFEKAINLIECIEREQELGHTEEKLFLLYDTAELHFKQHSFEKARVLYNRLFTIHSECRMVEGMIDDLEYIASTHYKQGNLPQALKTYQLALEKSQNSAQKALILYHVGKILYQQEQYHDSHEMLEEALKILTKLNSFGDEDEDYYLQKTKRLWEKVRTHLE